MGSKLYETRPELFRERWERMHFNVDAAASDANALVRPHKCHWSEGGYWCLLCNYATGRYYTAETNGLDREHYQPGDVVWCNPPFDHTIARWLKLASDCRRVGIPWELLLPASTDTRWFHEHIWDRRFQRAREGVELDFRPGRESFLLNGQPIRDARTGKVQSPRHQTMIVTFWPEGMRP